MFAGRSRQHVIAFSLSKCSLNVMITYRINQKHDAKCAFVTWLSDMAVDELA